MSKLAGIVYFDSRPISPEETARVQKALLLLQTNKLKEAGALLDKLGQGTRQSPDVLEALEYGVAALAWLVLPFGPSRWNWPLPQSRKTQQAKRKILGLKGSDRVAF